MYDIEYFLKITNRYHEEAKKCFKDRCYLTSFIAWGVVLEGVLLAMCFCYPERVRKTKVYREYKNKTKKKKNLFLELSLNDLLEIANELNWTPFQKEVEGTGVVKGWVYWVKQTRNLVHPARWLKRDEHFGDLHKWIKIKRGEWKKLKKLVELSEEAVDGVMIMLQSKINDDLTKRLKQ